MSRKKLRHVAKKRSDALNKIRAAKAAKLAFYKKILTLILILLLLIVIVGSIAYVIWWFGNRARIQSAGDYYNTLYERSYDVQPTTLFQASPAPTALPTPSYFYDGDQIIHDVQLGTIGPDTVVITSSPYSNFQESFSQLLAYNPDTVAYLDIKNLISLPVVQRPNDNEYYLTHNFDGIESDEGALFLDGVNSLAAGDQVLIVYGHNMKNGTMFGALPNYNSMEFMKRNPIISFDTIYENADYAIIGAFTASVNESVKNYFDLRQFLFTQESFDAYVEEIYSRSIYTTGVDTVYGDGILMLVTCESNNNDERFILAFRKIRDGESADSIIEKVTGAFLN